MDAWPLGKGRAARFRGHSLGPLSHSTEGGRIQLGLRPSETVSESLNRRRLANLGFGPSESLNRGLVSLGSRPPE